MTSKAALLLTLATVTAVASAQSPIRPGVYTELQAAEGKRTFDVGCGECHHLTLKGTGHGPELAGPNFLAKWGEHPIADIVTQISTKMPPTAPHTLSDRTVVALTAHILRVNGAAAGDKELRADSTLKIGRAVMGDQWDPAMATQAANAPSGSKFETWHGAASIADAAEKASGFVNKRVENFSPVTDAMLKDPPAADWLNWRRTQDGKGYSPLAQVNRRNVRQLKLAWVLTMHDGSNQATPLVHD